jgi:hypothetical protein
MTVNLGGLGQLGETDAMRGIYTTKRLVVKAQVDEGSAMRQGMRSRKTVRMDRYRILRPLITYSVVISEHSSGRALHYLTTWVFRPLLPDLHDSPTASSPW